MCLVMDYNKSLDLVYFNNFIIEENSYETLYNLIINNKNDFLKGRYKIAYGYVLSKTKISFRHCFLIDVISKKVIDPSCVKFINSPKEVKNYKYKVFTEFKSLEEYLFAIKFSKYIAKENEKSLERLLLDEENKMLEAFKKRDNIEENKKIMYPIIIAS